MTRIKRTERKNIMNEQWVLVSLEQGYYLGLEGVFDTKEEAIQYVEEELSYVKATEEYFQYYGEVDYVSQQGSKLRIAIQKVELNPKAQKYYGLYDLQLNGFKAGIASENKVEVEESGAARAYNLAQNDEKPIPDDWSTQKILKYYDYEAREINQAQFEKILESDEIGLLATVDLD